MKATPLCLFICCCRSHSRPYAPSKAFRKVPVCPASCTKQEALPSKRGSALWSIATTAAGHRRAVLNMCRSPSSRCQREPPAMYWSGSPEVPRRRALLCPNTPSLVACNGGAHTTVGGGHVTQYRMSPFGWTAVEDG